MIMMFSFFSTTPLSLFSPVFDAVVLGPGLQQVLEARMIPQQETVTVFKPYVRISKGLTGLRGMDCAFTPFGKTELNSGYSYVAWGSTIAAPM